MSATSTSFRHAVVFASTLFALLLVISCGEKAAPPVNTEQAKQQPTSAPPVSSPDEPPEPPSGIAFPTGFGRRTGDLDEMAKNRNIRALVILNPIGFFYDKGHPKGVMCEALEDFQKVANQKLKTGPIQTDVSQIIVTGPNLVTVSKKRDKTRCHIVWALSQVTVPKQSQP